MTDLERAQKISRRWLRRLGVCLHWDTPGSDYIDPQTGKPALTPDEAEQYERDREILWSLAVDPYAVAVDEGARLGYFPMPDDGEGCRHEPAPRIVPPLGAPLPTCRKCGLAYMPDADDSEDDA